MPQTANIFANTGNGSGGACSNQLTISNNLLAGGGFSIYPCGNATSQGTSTVSITGNRFARCGGGAEVQGGGGTWFCPGGADSAGYYPRAGSFGRLAAAYPNTVWTGNIWDDTGDAGVLARRAASDSRRPDAERREGERRPAGGLA